MRDNVHWKFIVQKIRQELSFFFMKSMNYIRIFFSL